MRISDWSSDVCSSDLTTIVVQLLSFGLHWLSPLLIAAGVFGFLSVRRSRHKNLARITLGLGVMLLSLQLIVQASAPLRESQVFGVLVEPLSHEILLVVLSGAMLNWAAHSSFAFVKTGRTSVRQRVCQHVYT